MQSDQSYGSGLFADIGSYTKLFNRYYPALVFFAHRLMKNRKDAEDIVSAIFVKLWEKRDGVWTEQSVKAFLYISTRNACFNTIKKNRNRARKDSTYRSFLDDVDSCTLNEITRAEVFRELHLLVNSLPTECRRIVIMWMGQLDNKEIAKKLQISIHTVKNQIARGAYLIRKKVKSRSDLLMIVAFHLMKHF